MRKIRIGIALGDVNGVGYEVVLKAFSDLVMLELCTPVIYGSSKAAAFYKKMLELELDFITVDTASDVVDGQLAIVNCCVDDIKVEFGKTDVEAGKMSMKSLSCLVDDYRNGLTDAVIVCPVNDTAIRESVADFPNCQNFLSNAFGEVDGACLKMLVKDNLRIAIANTGLPIQQAVSRVEKNSLKEMILTLNNSLKNDFGIGAPRIAVLSLNPMSGVNETPSDEERNEIIPAVQESSNDGIICYGPYSVDFMTDSDNFSHFDGILSMYDDQATGFFKAMTHDEGAVFYAGLPVVCASTIHGVEYDIAGKGMASEASVRKAIYLVTDVLRSRMMMEEASANPLRKQYHERRDDSDKLKQLAAQDQDSL